MVESIRAGRYMEASWNNIAPSRSQVIQWLMTAWNSPESRVTSKAIKKCTRLCHMDASLDETVSAWDDCKTKEAKVEVGKLSKAQQLALFHSPLGLDAEKEGEEDSVVSEIYENERVI